MFFDINSLVAREPVIRSSWFCAHSIQHKISVYKRAPKKLQKFICGVRVVQTFEEVTFLSNFAKALNCASILQNFQLFAVFRGNYHCGTYSPTVHLPWSESCANFWRSRFLWNFTKALNFATVLQNFQFFAVFWEDYCCGATANNYLKKQKKNKNDCGTDM